MAKRKVSCLPCRIKKVKCDGQQPCNRCESRMANCVYKKPGAVGRPPKNAVVNKLVLSHATSNDSAKETSRCREFIFENVSTTPVMAPTRYLQDTSEFGLAYYINCIFACYFSKNTALDALIKHRQLRHDLVRYREYSDVNPKIKIYDLTDYFSWMAADTASILMKRVSKLKLTYYSDLLFSQIALAYDRSTQFFETPLDGVVINPLNSLPPQQAVRLIECFFCIHPFCHTLSKTMLLQSFWTDTADPLLLTVVYGTTIFMSQLLDGKPLELWNALNKQKRNPFLDYAHYLLSKASAEATPSKYQALVLLSLFEVTFGFPRRGMSLFGLSYMVATKLGMFEDNMLGGLSPVEKELLLNSFWCSSEMTIRGCVELEQIPRTALSYRVHPYPPPTLQLSKAYQYDVENNNPRLFKNYFYLVETFFIKSVIARISSRIILELPYSSNLSSKSKIPAAVSNHFKVELFAPYPTGDNPAIEENIQCILVDFENFINNNKKDWSPMQVYTLNTFYLFYKINLTFLRDAIIDRQSGLPPYTLFNNYTPKELDLTDIENILRINKVIPDACQLIETVMEFLNEPSYYHRQVVFIPRGIIASSLDAAANVLIYAYRLKKSENIRYYLETAKNVLSMPIVWSDWETANVIKNVITEFLKDNPPATTNTTTTTVDTTAVDASTASTDTDATTTTITTEPFMAEGLFESLSTANMTSLSMPIMPSSYPWTSNDEAWMRDMNQVILSTGLLTTPINNFQTTPLPFLIQLEQDQDQQFVNDILDELF